MAMMSSQPSFGSSVGVAVLFYSGSLIFTILDIQKKKGDNSSANALAFALWWMTIAQVSIIAGCLLACNNPNVAAMLTGLTPKAGEGKFTPSSWVPKWVCRILNVVFKPVYPSVFQPVWIWQRGDQKMRWLRDTVAWRENSSRFREKVELRWWHWALLWASTVFLVLVPALLAFVVDYMSPKPGLGCRSLTVLVYFLSQLELTILTFIYYTRPADLRISPSQFLGERIRRWGWLLTFWLHIILGGLAVILALFTSVGGTLMEMIGVYDSYLCGISVTAWWGDIDAGVMFLASDTQAFRTSARLRSRCGYAAVAFLVVMCYIAYLFQRDLRNKFKDAVNDIGQLQEQVTTTTILEQHLRETNTADQGAVNVQILDIQNGKKPGPRRLNESNLDLGDNDSEKGDLDLPSDSEQDGFFNLTRVKDFVVQSVAFSKLRNDFGLFIFPVLKDPAGEVKDEGSAKSSTMSWERWRAEISVFLFFVRLLFRPLVSPGCLRITWICVCSTAAIVVKGYC
jgi:hypothetical protein